MFENSLSPASDLVLPDDRLVLQVPDLTGPIDWAATFGNAHPVEIEIGCGKGRFLIASAAHFPDINYVGIERARKYFRITKERVTRRALKNVRLLRDDADYFMRKFVPDASVAAYHVYFPDPWPKKRHRKRRFFKPGSIAQIERTLRPGGTIDVASDHAAYYEDIRSLLDAAAALARMDDLPERVRLLGPGMTNFEVKYAAEGRPIYRASYRRRHA